jgi:DNA-binding transcriptional LysR family regulator
MQPTPRALRLAPGIAAALEALRGTLGRELPFDPAVAERTFVIGLTDYVLAVVGPPLVTLVRQSGPGLHLRLVAYAKDELGPLIAGGVLDLALGVLADPPPDVVVTELFEERFVGIARRGHPVLAAAPDAAGYAALDHALYTTRRDATGSVDTALAALGLARRVAVTVPFLAQLPRIIAASDLVAAIPARAAAMLCGDDVVPFAIPLDLAPWRLQMVWNPLARSDQGSAWLRETVRAVCAAAPGGDAGGGGAAPDGRRSCGVTA